MKDVTVQAELGLHGFVIMISAVRNNQPHLIALMGNAI
jgi:hypothetical protein